MILIRGEVLLGGGPNWPLTPVPTAPGLRPRPVPPGSLPPGALLLVLTGPAVPLLKASVTARAQAAFYRLVKGSGSRPVGVAQALGSLMDTVAAAVCRTRL